MVFASSVGARLPDRLRAGNNHVVDPGPLSVLWVLLPVYRDVESFLALRQALIKTLSGGLRIGRVQIVVVDDSAGLDPEMARMRDLDDVVVLTPPFNLGHQRALVFGLRTLSDRIKDEDVVVTLDADGEDRPEDVPRLLASLADKGDVKHTIVLARRVGRRESLAFKVMYFCFKVLFATLTGLIVKTGNFAAYRGWVARNVLFHPHFDVCYSSSLLSLNLPVCLVPCDRGPRYAGRSHMSLLHLLMHGIRMMMPFLDRIAVRSLVCFSGLFFLGLACTLAAVGLSLFGGIAVPGWVSYGILLLLTISFLALGNFVIIFTVFAQSQGVSLASLDRTRDSRT